MLKEALKANPSNIPVQLKLLNIYANRKDLNAFTGIARKVKDTGDASAWAEAAALGRAIDSSNPMYEGVGTEAAVAAAAAIAEPARPGAMPALDMDIGFNIPMDLDVTAAAPAVEPSAQPMDFDVSGASASPMDFEVTGSRPGEPEALLPDFDVTGGRLGVVTEHMDFDVTGSHPNVTEGLNMDFDVTGAHPSLAEPLAMDFDVTGSHPNVTPAQQMDFDVTGSHPNVAAGLRMDFDVTGSQPGVVAAAAAPDSNMSTVVLSSPMDFDISARPVAPAPVAEPAPSSFEGMDFDLSATPAPASDEAPSSFGGMDFDISAATPAPAPAAPGAEALSSFGGMDFDISAAPPTQAAPSQPAFDLGLSGISLDLGEADTVVFPASEAKKDERWQDVENKLELARAFQEMGNVDNARELLAEVLNEGDDQQMEAARTLMQQL